ncbi:PR domain zinc finger protein 10 [Heterodontus francisci]|uniref:PR domain zinc finger protein 10 n=1 Tax=Heterodontus francisci TaxID=7792 RepID=UPI00355B217F
MRLLRASSMESKTEDPPVWDAPSEQDQTATQVHFVPESSAVAQIVYTDEQDRPSQQVVYTADGTSYTSVDGAEHTLVYIHQADGAQTVFTDQSQVAYIQQDATTQQVTVLLPASQNVTGANLAVLGSVTEAQQPMTENNSQSLLPVSHHGIPQITGASDSAQQMPETMATTEHDLDSDEDDDEEEEEDDVDSSDIDDWEPGPPRPFNPCDLWCEDCNKAHPAACLKHGTLHCIPNRPVLTRARASLPLILYINRFAGGIFSKRRIPKRTQFGPVEGPLIKQSELKDNYIHLKVAMGVGREDCKDEEKPGDLWFDLSDENLCNWLMFVRQAQNHLEQNLVVYQYGKNLYFTTIKHIEPKQELKVWYAASYADFVERKIHDISEEERKVAIEMVLLITLFSGSTSLSDTDAVLLRRNCAIYSNAKPEFPKRIYICMDTFEQQTCDKRFCSEGSTDPLHPLRTHELKREKSPPSNKVCEEYWAPTIKDFTTSLKNSNRNQLQILPQSFPLHFFSFLFLAACVYRACMLVWVHRVSVNHLSKRHPDIRIDDVPELTLPIIKPNRDYYCQYCDKVYKSASKRKAHILKNHPGAELPPSIRKLRPAAPGEPDPMLSTHTQLKGTIATLPVCCPHCCKQYSSKAKMVQHIRKKHTDVLQENPNALQTLPAQTPIVATVISAAPTVVNTDGSTGDTIVTTDLLTQAMSELSQTLTTDYRPPQGDYQRVQYIPVSQHIQPVQGQQPQHIQLQVVQVAQASSPQQNQHSTVDVSQLHDPHAFTQHSVQVQHVQVTDQSSTMAATGSQSGGGQPLSPSSQQQQELSPSQIQGGTSTLQQQPTATVQHTYLPSTWGTYRNYSSEIQMMTIPQTQYVIAEAPVATVNSGQVKAVTQTHYVISEGQPELDLKQNAAVRLGVPQTQTDTSLQQQNAQFIITSTASGNGTTEVPITKP